MRPGSSQDHSQKSCSRAELARMTHSLPSEVTSHRCSWYFSATAATRNSALSTLLPPTTRKDPLWFFFAPASGSCMGACDWQSLGHTLSPKAGWESPSSASPEGSKFSSRHNVQGKKSSHNWKRVQNPNRRILIVIVITNKSAFHEFRRNPRSWVVSAGRGGELGMTDWLFRTQLCHSSQSVFTVRSYWINFRQIYFRFMNGH